jgi:hypothetical protein
MTPAILKASWNPCGLSRRHHPQIEQSLQLGFDLGAKPIDPVAVVHKSVLLQSRDDSAHVRFLIAAPFASSPADGAKVVDAMKATQYDDPLFGPTKVRVDGRAVHAMYLAEVKKPSESKGPYDYFKIVTTIPADQAFRPLAEEKGVCSLVQQVAQTGH